MEEKIKYLKTQLKERMEKSDPNDYMEKMFLLGYETCILELNLHINEKKLK